MNLKDRCYFCGAPEDLGDVTIDVQWQAGEVVMDGERHVACCPICVEEERTHGDWVDRTLGGAA